MSSPSKTVAIWNPASGSAPDEAELKEALGPDTELVETTEDDPGPGQTRAAVESGADMVVACGGDGTIRACMKPLLETDTVLGMVPLGTGNLLAQNLSIPAGLEAADDLHDRPTMEMDVGTVNGEVFAVMAGTGFDAEMIRDADEDKKARFGRLAYVGSAAKHLGDQLVTTTVTVDGEHWFTGRTAMVLVGNHGVVSGGLEVFPDAECDDGKLDVAVLAAKSAKEWGSVLWRLVRNKDQRDDLVSRTQASRTIEIRTQRPRAYQLDGEDREPTTSLSVEVRPHALRIQHGLEPDPDARTEPGEER